jgi:hypothetical protein
MHKSWSYLRQYGFIGYNLFCLWIRWWKTQWSDNVCSPFRR